MKGGCTTMGAECKPKGHYFAEPHSRDRDAPSIKKIQVKLTNGLSIFAVFSLGSRLHAVVR